MLVEFVRMAFFLIVFASAVVTACHASRNVESLLTDPSLGLPVDRVRTDGVWSTGEAGHGLQVQVWATTGLASYQPNLDLELAGAATACAALAKHPPDREWAYVHLYYFNTYQTTKRVVGVAEVVIRSEVLRAIGTGTEPLADCPRHWRFVSGHKDQPDSDELLSW